MEEPSQRCRAKHVCDRLMGKGRVLRRKNSTEYSRLIKKDENVEEALIFHTRTLVRAISVE